MPHASGTSDDEEEWLELEDEELPRDMPLSCDVLGEGDEEEAADRGESDERLAAPRSVVPPSQSEEEGLDASVEALELGDEELEADLPLRSEELSLDDEEEDAEPTPAEEHIEAVQRLPASSTHEDAELATSDDEFELGEDDVPADLPLSCEALGADDAAIETRAASPRRDTELGLELIDDLMLELADDVQGLRSALQREGEEISQLEQDLICLDESTQDPAGGAAENATAQSHLGLRELAGNAPEGAGEIRFAGPPASVPPDPEVIAELDEPEAEASDEDEEGWLELEDEEFSRDLPLSCSALGEPDDEDIHELGSERDEEDPA
ncbi:MAG: hypothetical protein JNM84_00980 [Planctomycetes bacterium]|nr:hypothetical protein [Planctomycetota bacterium]